jgi:hypothetical protein
MNQPQAQQLPQISYQRTLSANRVAASISRMRTVAFSLLVDRALSA